MEFDFDAADRVSDYVTVPAGTYLCRIAEVRPGSTRAGDERWSMRLVVAEGQHIGKQAAWDSLVFSTRGRSRARMVLQALGLPATGKVQLEPAQLEGRTALVEIRPAEYQGPAGEMIRRNEVPYDGYRALPAGEALGREALGREALGTGSPTASHRVATIPGNPAAKRPGPAAVDANEIPF
jgi:hypothetical protein